MTTVWRNAYAHGLLGVTLLLIAGCGNGTDEAGHGAHAGGHDEHDEHAGQEAHVGDGIVVHLDAEQHRAAGIETTTAAAGPIEETLQLVARVASNEDSIVHVTPRVEGIVQEIHTGLGEQVQEGDPLVELWSMHLGDKVSAYQQARAMVTAAEETLAQSEELYRRRLETLRDVWEGEIAVARKIHEREEGLQEEGIATIRPYLEADKELQKARLAKEREITALTAERDARLLELEVALRRRRIELDAAKEQLLVLGFDGQEVEAFAEEGHRHGRMLLHAPSDGVVLDRHITLHEHVDTGDALFVIHDLSTVWVLASAYEKDLARLRQGQKVYLRLEALPGTAITGEIDVIDYRVSETTRAASVRVEVPNEPVENWDVDYPLRPGMFGEVEVVVESWTGRVVLPESAIVHEGEESFVFVGVPDEPRAYRREHVEVVPGARGLVEITTGVDPGDEVVVKGMFTLKSLARSEQLGQGHSH